MILKELIRNNSWLSVKLRLLDLYPEEIENISEYESVYNQLGIMNIKESDMILVLESVFNDGIDNEPYVDVYGKKGKTQDENRESEIIDSYALEITSWDEWLGMEIDQKTIEKFTKLEIISHCLYEMTFIDFEQDEIQQEFERIKRTTDKIKNMTEEERKEKLIPWDKLKNELNSEDE